MVDVIAFPRRASQPWPEHITQTVNLANGARSVLDCADFFAKREIYRDEALEIMILVEKLGEVHGRICDKIRAELALRMTEPPAR